MTEFDDGVSHIFPRMWKERANFKPEDFAQLADKIVAELGPLAENIDGDKIIREASTNSWNGDAGTSVLVLEAAGLLSLDRTPDAYVVAHQTSLELAGASDYLLEGNPAFTAQTFWRFFEIAGGGEISLRNLGFRWPDTIARWVYHGQLPRERVLASCLEALNRDFGAYTSGWYSALFNKLEPTVDELVPLESAILRLLGSSVGATVTLAVTACKRLNAAGFLSIQPFVDSAAAAVGGTKSSALTVLGIAKDADASSLFTVALEHPHRDVQLTAAKWLVKHGYRSVVEEARSSMAPSVLTAVGLALESAEGVHEVSGERTWQPLVTWPDDEVVERLAVLLEDASDPVEVENGLRALATTEDFTALAPLAKAARRAVSRAEGYPNEGASLSALVGMIVLAASGIDHGSKVSRLVDLYPPLVYPRFDEVRERVLRRGAPHVLLATPIDSAGWVRPIDLASRLTTEVWPADLAAALLRLAPEGRAEALAALPPQLPREVRDVVVFAFGAKPGKIRTAQWWVAAAQSLDPWAEHKALISARLGRHGQGRPVAAKLIAEYEHNSAADRARYVGLPVGFWRVKFDAGDSRLKSLVQPADQPTVFEPQRKTGWEWGSVFGTLNADVAAFVGPTWPRSTEVAAYTGIRALISRSVHGETGHSAEATLSAIAASPGTVGELGRSAIVLGLSGKDVPLRRHAAEVFVDVVPRRTSVDEFAATLSSIIGLCTLTRLTDSLVDAAGLSASAASTVTDLLISALPAIPREMTGLASLLALLDDELLRAARATDDPALRDYLAGFAGSSKAAKSAKAMLAR